MTALNKIDLLVGAELVPTLDILDTSLSPNAVAISALKQTGLEALQAKIAEVLAANMDRVNVRIPFHNGDLVELFHRRGHVDTEEHVADGVHIDGRIPRSLRGYYAPFVMVAGR